MERFKKESMHIRMRLIISITALSRNYLDYRNTWGPCGLRTSYSVSRNSLPMLNRWNYSEIHCFSVNLYRHVPWTIFETRSMKYLPIFHIKNLTCTAVVSKWTNRVPLSFAHRDQIKHNAFNHLS